MYAYIKLPSFIPLIRQLSNPEIAAFFIKETAYWGSDVEVGYLEEYFDSPDQNFRKAAFEGMGLRRFVAAEEKMKACFYNQSESIKRVILESILSIRSGKSATFIKEVFDTSASRFTKRTALYCLWYYGNTGKELFMEMKKQHRKMTSCCLIKWKELQIKNLHAHICLYERVYHRILWADHFRLFHCLDHFVCRFDLVGGNLDHA